MCCVFISWIGANIEQLCEKHNVRIDIPRKDDNLIIPTGNPTIPCYGSPLPDSGEDDEPTQPVSVVGFLDSIAGAMTEINESIANKDPQAIRRVSNIPENVNPFIVSCLSEYEALAKVERYRVSLNLSAPSHEFIVSGDLLGVLKIFETVKADVKKLDESLSSTVMSLERPQHRLLAGGFAEGLMVSFRCIAILPTDPDVKEIVVWGLLDDLLLGLQAVVKVSSHTFPPISTYVWL